MKLIGLTGSIATGKSTVSQMCRDAGVPIHDADRAVHKLLGPYGAAVSDVLFHFGDIGSISAGIDRQVLGSLVFKEPEKRQQLEHIIHPLVLQDREKFLQACHRHKCRHVILDIPLLFETGSDSECDKVIVVWAPEWMQRKRALLRYGMTAEKLDAILPRQVSQAVKRRLADLVLPSSLGRAETRKRLLRWLRAP